MNTRLRSFVLSAIASTALAGATLAPTMALADDAPDNPNQDRFVQATKSGAANQKLQLSQDGFNVMRDVRAARIAIFNGDTEAATKFVDLAKADLQKSQKDESLIEHRGDAAPGTTWVPIDGELIVSDNFVVTPEKAKHIAAGNQKIKEGKANEALEQLKLADIAVGFTRVLMPLAETKLHVDVAADMIQSDDFYEANMALKAAEDGLNFETVGLIDVPKPAKSAGEEKTPTADKAAPDEKKAE